MKPLLFLGLIIFITAAAALMDVIQRRRSRRIMLALAAELGMSYSFRDRFGLADRVAEHFPIPGVASLRVIDLLYASERNGYRYLFSAEYTNGVIRSKHRVRRAVTFFESKTVSDAAVWSTLTIAPAELPVVEQYRFLAKRQSPSDVTRDIPV